MTTYALFIATDPDPVSSTDWSHIDQVFDRARLSSGGTKVLVRSTEGDGTEADDFDTPVATFVNGIHLEIRDDGGDTITYLGDDRVIGTAKLSGDTWTLTQEPGATDGGREEVATLPAADQSREEVAVRLGRLVEDWLS